MPTESLPQPYCSDEPATRHARNSPSDKGQVAGDKPECGRRIPTLGHASAPRPRQPSLARIRSQGPVARHTSPTCGTPRTNSRIPSLGPGLPTDEVPLLLASSRFCPLRLSPNPALKYSVMIPASSVPQGKRRTERLRNLLLLSCLASESRTLVHASVVPGDRYRQRKHFRLDQHCHRRYNQPTYDKRFLRL